MQLFIAALLGGLIQMAGSLVGRVLLSLGIGYVAYLGIDASIVWARDLMISRFSSTGAQTVRTLGAMQLGTCVSILTSAVTARLVLSGMTSGVVKRMVMK